MNTETILEKLIGFDTTSRNSNLELMDFVAGFLRGHGISSQLIHDATGTKANLYATIGPRNKSGVMLSGHSDVVPVDGQDWSRDPFRLYEENGKFYGRGTADMKGFIACALRAASMASERSLETPLHLAFSHDEEIGCVGVRSMVDMLADAPQRPAMCIVGEPTSLTIATGHKGKTGLDVTCTGREGHSALAPKAANAIYMANDLINGIREAQQRIIETGARDEDYEVPYTTLHVGTITGGTALNIVPNKCQLKFEIRNLAADDPVKILQDITERAAVIASRYRDTAPEADIGIETFNTYPGMDTPKGSDVIRFVQSLTGGNSTCKVAFGTEGGLFSSVLDIPTVVCGPGSMDQGHKPDEFIELEQLARCDRMLDRLVDRLESGF